MANFRPTDRLTSFLLPPSIDEWLPERDLARFVAEVIESLDLTAMSKSYRGTGSEDRGHGEKTRRQTTPAAGRTATAQGSDQSDR